MRRETGRQGSCFVALEGERDCRRGCISNREGKSLARGRTPLEPRRPGLGRWTHLQDSGKRKRTLSRKAGRKEQTRSREGKEKMCHLLWERQRELVEAKQVPGRLEERGGAASN